MAFFSKPPAKPKPDARATPARPGPRPVSARELAAGRAKTADAKPATEPAGADITVTGTSLIEWSPTHPAIEVQQANPGLCTVLENAALLHASGQSQPARTLLEEGVETDHDTKLSPLAWLALFDLLQRAGDRAAFDQLALQFVVQFERSAPAWEGPAQPKPAAPRGMGGYVAMAGKLTAASAPQIENLRRVAAKNVAQARLDLAAVTACDDDGARLLATALAEVRRKRFVLTLQRPEKLVAGLEALVKKGRDGGEGAWQLSLELLQWTHRQALFDDRAIEFAIAFELSPPSWEPPVRPEDADGAAKEGEGGAVDSGVVGENGALVVSGVLSGTHDPALLKLQELAQSRPVVAVDMAAVDRIDFVCAGSLLNAINRIEAQRRAVQIIGATPIVRALLLLIGISPRHFVRKTA